MSLTAAILFNTPPPHFTGTQRRHLMDNRPVTSQTYCREHCVQIRLANVETVFAAVDAGKRTITEIEEHTRLGRVTVSRALAELEDNQRVKRSRPGKQTIFEVTP